MASPSLAALVDDTGVLPPLTEDMASLTVDEAVLKPELPPHRSHDPSNNVKQSDPFQFGQRYLQAGDDVFEFNAWDHVEIDEEFKAWAAEQIEKQRQSPVSDFDKSKSLYFLLSCKLLRYSDDTQT
jgi:tRNAThr (cytosine32-N3)-methyltransferase